MPAKVKTRSKSRSKSKQPKTSQPNSRLNRTLPAAQIEGTLKTEKSFAKLNRVLKIESLQKHPLETSTPSNKPAEKESHNKGRASDSKGLSRGKRSDIGLRVSKEGKDEGKPERHNPRAKEQPPKPTSKGNSKRKNQISQSSLSSSKSDFKKEPHPVTHKKRPSSHSKTGNSPSQQKEKVQVQRPYKFDKVAFLLKQAQNRIGNLLSKFKFSKLAGIKLGFGKKLAYALEFESGEGKRVVEDFCGFEVRVMGKILKEDLELLFLEEFLRAESR